MIETSSSRRTRDAIRSAHKLRAEAFGTMFDAIFGIRK